MIHTHFPILKAHTTLKAVWADFDQQWIFSGFTLSSGVVKRFSESIYTLLVQCDGQSTLQDILSRYSLECHTQLLETIQSSPVFNHFIYWSETAVPDAINPNQIPEPVSHLLPLKVALFHITNNCNFRCEHCYHNDYHSPNDLTLPEIETLFQQLSELGTHAVLLTGGEPFTRRDILDIIQLTEKYYLNLQINTNGYFITEEIIDKLRKTPAGILSISLDGPNEAIHNLIRKNPHSWEKLMSLFPMMQEKRMPLRINSALTKYWLDDLSQIDGLIDYLNQFNVATWVLNSASPTGEALNTAYQTDYQLSYLESLTISRYILKRLQEKQPSNIKQVVIEEVFAWEPGQTDTILPVLNKSGYDTYGDNEILCDKHKDLFMIEPDGTIPFCSLFKSRFPMEIGNIRSEPVASLWHKLCQIRIDHALPKREFCSSCDIAPYCGGGCPGHNPNPSANLLTTCDTKNKTLIPHIRKDYDKVISMDSWPMTF